MTVAPETPPAGRKRWLAITSFVIVAAIVGIGLWLSRQSGPDQVQAMVDADEIIVSAKVAGRVELTGIVRRNQERRQFAPENAPDKNVWFFVDVPLMRKLAGAAPDPKLDAFFLEADAAPNPGGVPMGGQTRLDIPNDHLQYAITWFLLALALAGVYLAYHWENGRLEIAGRTKRKP